MPQGVAIMVGESPVADGELLAAVSVEVLEGLGRTTRYALRYAVGPADGDLTWLSDDRLTAGSTLRIQVSSPQGETCLVKGPVTGQQIHLVHGGSGSTLEVLGADAGLLMDRETKTEAFTSGADSDVVTQIVGTYGFIPDVKSTGGRRIGERGPPLVQRETDLRFVRRLARRNGACFWFECDALTGLQTARFQRVDLGQSPEHSLAINQDPANLETLELRWDAERPTAIDAHQLDLDALEVSASTVNEPPSAKLAGQRLANITGDRRSLRLTAASVDAADMKARAEAAAIEADLFVVASGETTVSALGGVLRAHRIVELKGAGARHSGPYLVTSVRHTIDSGGHTMRFELARNGWEA